ncbi:response regulator transcription factor [Nocardioides sp. zg-1308]|uniref:Response regulator transcription factor n=1 Tax=Nocardioides renjunii TaxID=3095075 RepID=A0ABU5K9L7_9ACTN|nr:MULTISPECIES: response regulator transcription factor [unclassified Nocardioides]MDZ5661280.1 response regulator transcription factor [Nocardioides sp. S-58]NPD04396.1 response regulator transcription factor [Nocardioides sp. zg-1308]WQQ22283.1 response regulator transcription factor [Nocardioides sp. S-34]
MIIRVALLGADELVRRGLEGMLSTLGGFELCSVKDREARPIDVALVETYGASTDASTVARAVADPYIRRVAVFTWNHHPGLVNEVVRSGVSGYLAKSLTAPQLGRALRAIHDGELVVAPAHLGRREQDIASLNDVDHLTTRERETLALIATGRSNDEIAQEMRISLNSVKSYIRSAYRKTGVQSRSQAVLWAVSHGLNAQVLERV